MLGAALFFCATLATGLSILQWGWIQFGYTSGLAFKFALLTTTGALVFFLVVRNNSLSSLWNLRRIDRKWVYGGHAGLTGMIASILIIAAPTTTLFWSLSEIINTFPTPTKLDVIKENPALDSTLKPVFLWEYATVFDPRWFREFEIVLPYEKGPPQKLLGSFYLQHRKTRALGAAFYGKRPRQYDRSTVAALFSERAATYPHPRHWPLLYNLAREAGALGANRLSLFETPYASRIGTSERLFFWSPAGAVFQARCDSPCVFEPMLSHVRFAEDSKASLKSRQDLTKAKLKMLLETYPKNAEQRVLHESELVLTLISWLTLDPRDPEAFFHIGKLATNRETVASAVRYGKDLKMSAPQIAELETRLATFEY